MLGDRVWRPAVTELLTLAKLAIEVRAAEEFRVVGHYQQMNISVPRFAE
jgi:hypothetical protein